MMNLRRTRILLVFLLLVGATLLALAAGCTGAPGLLYDCNLPIVDRLDHLGKPDSCCQVDPCPCSCIDSEQYPCNNKTGNVPSNILDCKISDAGTDASASCGGTCAPIPPFGAWEGPGLFWSGPTGTAPPCPDEAPFIGYQGHSDIIASPLCDACTCAPSTGECSPPSSITASSEPCGKPGTDTPFDGPAGWDGSCTANDCVGAAPQCTHALSILSLAVTPVIITAEACAPSPTTDTPNAPTWMGDVLACRGLVTCGNAGAACVPAAMPPGFKTCIYSEGEAVCPDSYPDRHLVHAGHDDTRACAPCGCGTPVGGLCQGTLAVFANAACTPPSPPLLFPAVTWDSSGPACLPVTLPLGSKTVTLSPYEAGTCVPSGGPSGSVQPIGPSTFCCLA
jgi:hypothetical protein